MKKTISVQAFNRIDLLRKCLDYIYSMEGIDGWHVNLFCDNPGHDNIPKVISKEYPQLTNIIFRDKNLGLKHSNKETIKDQFEYFNSDINLHIEEDVLVGHDVLYFIEYCDRHIDLSDKVITLCEEQINTPPGYLHKRIAFDCWGWCIKKEFYFNHFRNIKDDYRFDGWAGEVWNYMVDNKLYEIHSSRRKSRNIGEKTGYHGYISKDYARRDNSLWSGEDIEASESYDLSCINKQCKYCQQIPVKRKKG